MSKWKFGKWVVFLWLIKGHMFGSRVLSGVAACSFRVVFLISLSVNVTFWRHWPPWCSPACQPCSATGHLHRNLPCLESFFPFICKAGSLILLRLKYELLTEDVHGPPLVVLRIINAICSSGSKVTKEYFQSCKVYLPLLENVKGIQCVFLKNLSNNSKNPLPSLLPQTVLNHLSSELLFTPAIHTFLKSWPLLPAQFFMCKSLEPHGLLSVFFLINLQPGERWICPFLWVGRWAWPG